MKRRSLMKIDEPAKLVCFILFSCLAVNLQVRIASPIACAMAIHLHIEHQFALPGVPRQLADKMPEELYGHLPSEEYKNLKNRIDCEFRKLAAVSVQLNPMRLTFYGAQVCIILAIVVMAIVDIFFLEERWIGLYVVEACIVLLCTGIVALGLFYLQKRLTVAALMTEERLKALLAQQIGSCPMTFQLTVQPRVRYPPVYGIVAVPMGPMHVPFAFFESACPPMPPDILPNVVTKVGPNFC